jgi:hypothetical protein
MKKEYKMKKAALGNYRNIWEDIPSLNIECHPWSNNYNPKVEVKLFYTDTHFHIYFKVWEKKIKAVYKNVSEDVYKDSCVEFFFNPNPKGDDRYFNFEINPLGTLLIGLGKDRKSRIRITDVDVSIFNVSTSVNEKNIKEYKGDYWTVEYSIPFSFIEKYFGQFNLRDMKRITGNFYKCGDETEYPHYGCWSLIDVKAPDFHRPEYFGDIIL